MTDLRATIAPKSDQLNADDLIGRALTIKVTGVKLCAEPDQPIAINFEGDNGKPYKPCKSMRRVLVQIWGSDGNAFVGRRMRLYRDDKVQFGGMAVGGIRISQMSDMAGPVTMALTATRANRKPYTVQPLPAEQGTVDMRRNLDAEAEAAAAQGMPAYEAFWKGLAADDRKALLSGHEARKATAAAVGAPPSSSSTESAANALQACTSLQEFNKVLDALPIDVCREIGAEALDEMRSKLEG